MTLKARRPEKSSPDLLVPVIAQDVRTNDVLMVAWANREALAKTKKTGYMHYWSRSRGRLWKKGEESGHVQKVVSLHWDCDRDTLLARVEQTGPACHRNTYSCFAKKPFPARDVFRELEAVFRDRKRRPKPGSYTNLLLSDRNKRLKKLAEEAGEAILAARGESKKRLASEAADVLYHLLVILFARGVSWANVARELEGRRK